MMNAIINHVVPSPVFQLPGTLNQCFNFHVSSHEQSASKMHACVGGH